MFRELTDEQWQHVEGLLSPTQNSSTQSKNRGRPPADNRMVLNGILYVLLTGSAWNKIPSQYAGPTTCWRRLKAWSEDGTWARVWRELLVVYDDETKQLWAEALLNGYFQPCKLGERPSKMQDDSPQSPQKRKNKKA